MHTEEVVQVIRKLKNNKATGMDGIGGELIKYGGQIMEEEMIKIFTKVWREERMPEEWEEGIYLPLHKRDDKLVCDNYRGLCLLNVGYKILSSLLCRRLLPYYMRIVGDYQAGFVPGKSTIDNIFALRLLNEKYREYGRTAWHVFVDYKQAYDSVHRPSLWAILRHFHVPGNLIRLIQSCTTTAEVEFVWGET